MNNKEGEIVKGIIRRVENDTVYLEMAGTQIEGAPLSSCTTLFIRIPF